MWVIKVKGKTRDGAYFWQSILTDRVIPFLNDPINVLVIGDAVFVYNNAPCMRANATQQRLKQANVDFGGNDIWPGNSPNLNVAENIAAILKDEVEAQMLAKMDLVDIHMKLSAKMSKS